MNLTIGLIGFGCVGKGLYDVLERTHGLRNTIKHIVVKHRDKERPLPQERFSYDVNDILTDPEVNVVVELIDDADAAYDIVRRALLSGKSVVTANKRMVADHCTIHANAEFSDGVPAFDVDVGKDCAERERHSAVGVHDRAVGRRLGFPRGRAVVPRFNGNLACIDLA